MTDYRQVDVTTLTFDDAYNDAEWGKRPWDYVAFAAIDTGVLESFDDFSDEELLETMRAVAAYCVKGELPNYGEMRTTAAKIAVRTIIRAHDARINAEYLKHYRQYVTAMKKKQDKHT